MLETKRYLMLGLTAIDPVNEWPSCWNNSKRLKVTELGASGDEARDYHVKKTFVPEYGDGTKGGWLIRNKGRLILRGDLTHNNQVHHPYIYIALSVLCIKSRFRTAKTKTPMGRS